MQYEQFHALPPAKKAAPLVLLLGEERFFKEQALREIEEALGPGAHRVEFQASGARGAPAGAPASRGGLRGAGAAADGFLWGAYGFRVARIGCMSIFH